MRDPHPHRSPRPPRPAFAAVLLLLAALLLPACQTYGPTASPSQIDTYAKRTYPADAPRGDDLNIAVEQHGPNLQLLSREPRDLRDLQLWINRQYVRDLPHIKPGADNRLLLTGLINQYREPFPVGTVLAPDKTARVVLAELYDPRRNQRHRLITWPKGPAGLKLLPW